MSLSFLAITHIQQKKKIIGADSVENRLITRNGQLDTLTNLSSDQRKLFDKGLFTNGGDQGKRDGPQIWVITVLFCVTRGGRGSEKQRDVICFSACFFGIFLPSTGLDISLPHPLICTPLLYPFADMEKQKNRGMIQSGMCFQTSFLVWVSSALGTCSRFPATSLSEHVSNLSKICANFEPQLTEIGPKFKQNMILIR